MLLLISCSLGVSHSQFAKSLWPIINGFLPSAAELPLQSLEIFNLVYLDLLQLLATSRDDVDMTALVQLLSQLILNHQTTEVRIVKTSFS
jgi:hypothetical protein